MVRNIILSLLAFTLLALLIVWVLSGGPRKIVTSTKESIVSVVPSEGSTGFRLPWQPVQIFPTLDITDALNFADEKTSPNPSERLAQLETEYEHLKSEVDKGRTFGNPSPYAGKIIIGDDAGFRADSANEEYIQLDAAYTNTAPIDITGFVLESALTGARIAIPPAASPFVANGPNTIVSVSLDPGALALVATAASPVGVSFRENRCTGYLGQFQTFSLPLGEDCPAPSSVLPLNEENLRRFGEDCFDAVQNLSQCRFPQNLPDSISASCRTYLTEFLSYTGCVNQNRYKSAFQKDRWRIFLGSQTELWRNSHDAIRLLDREGRTVSVLVY